MVNNSKKKIRIDCQLGIGVSLRVKPLTYGHWSRQYMSNKLSYRSLPCFFLCYAPSHKGYICLDSLTGRLYISYHVLFHENDFPLSSSFTPPAFETINITTQAFPLFSIPFPTSHPLVPNPSLEPPCHSQFMFLYFLPCCSLD